MSSRIINEKLRILRPSVNGRLRFRRHCPHIKVTAVFAVIKHRMPVILYKPGVFGKHTRGSVDNAVLGKTVMPVVPRLNVIVAESRFKTGAGGTAACTVCLYNSVARVIGGRRKRRYIKIVV